MNKRIVTKATLLMTVSAATMQCFAEEQNTLLANNSYYMRAGFYIGGTAPVGLPASIRSLDSYSPKANVMVGVEAQHPFNNLWGLSVGLRFENKGMKTNAKVKNYHMKLTQGTQELEGMFTGNVLTKANQMMLTMPVQATLNVSKKWRLKLGPYVSYNLDRSFDGYAYDGYLRYINPTGQKTILGNEEETRGNYDFTSDMRRWQWGVDFGADWQFSKQWGTSVSIAWGLNGIFEKDFAVIEQTLYPIYGQVSMTYKLK